MNTKNNKRRQNTILKIETVFLELLRQQDLPQISVTAICEKAGINRGTFYANFADVYDLAEKLHGRLKLDVNHLLAQVFVEGNTESAFFSLLQHMKENQDLYTFYFRLGYDHNEALPLGDVSQFFHSGDPQHLEYHLAFFQSGFNAIIKRWLSRGCLETPEEIRDILLLEYRGRLTH